MVGDPLSRGSEFERTPTVRRGQTGSTVSPERIEVLKTAEVISAECEAASVQGELPVLTKVAQEFDHKNKTKPL